MRKIFLHLWKCTQVFRFRIHLSGRKNRPVFVFKSLRSSFNCFYLESPASCFLRGRELSVLRVAFVKLTEFSFVRQYYWNVVHRNCVHHCWRCVYLYVRIINAISFYIPSAVRCCSSVYCVKFNFSYFCSIQLDMEREEDRERARKNEKREGKEKHYNQDVFALRKAD